MKKRGVHPTSRATVRIQVKDMKSRNVVTPRQSYRPQRASGQGFRAQRQSVANKVYVDNGKSYVIVAKETVASNRRGIVYHNTQKVKGSTNQRSWRKAYTHVKHAGSQQARMGWNQRQQFQSRSAVSRQYQGPVYSQWGNGRWSNSDKRNSHAASFGQTGIYQPPHRRENEPMRRQAPAAQGGWGQQSRGAGKGPFRRQNQRYLGNASQGRRGDGGF